jgi:hypothetical protein
LSAVEPRPAPAAAEGDSSKPKPNDGRLPHDPDPKLWYASERIVVRAVDLAGFDHDRALLPLGTPGFHVFGSCPSCHHETTGLCATEYLSLELPVSRGARVPVRVRVDSATSSKPMTTMRVATTSEFGLTPEQLDEITRDIGGSTSATDEVLAAHPELPPSNDVPVKTMLTVLRCACVANHVGPTAGVFGCGSEWLVRVTYDPTNTTTTTMTPVTYEESVKCWPAADAAATAVPTTLTTAQAAVGKWQTGLTAVIAVLGVTALLSNRATIQTLSVGWQVLFAIAAAVAVGANIVMLLQSDLASFGFPNIRQALPPSDLHNADLDPLTQTRVTVRKLRVSAWATATAVLAAITAVTIILFVHPAPPQPTYKITTVTGVTTTTTACGTITYQPTAQVGQPAPTTLTFKPNTKRAKPVAVALSSVTNIAAC